MIDIQQITSISNKSINVSKDIISIGHYPTVNDVNSSDCSTPIYIKPKFQIINNNRPRYFRLHKDPNKLDKYCLEASAHIDIDRTIIIRDETNDPPTYTCFDNADDISIKTESQDHINTMQIDNFKEFIESIPELPGIYLILIKDDYYKFGHTGNLRKRLTDHYHEFEYKCLIKHYICAHKTIAWEIEDDIKVLLEEGNYLVSYPKNIVQGKFHKEVFRATDDDIIRKILNTIDEYLITNQLRVEKYKQLYEFEKSINIDYPCIPLKQKITLKQKNKKILKDTVRNISPELYQKIVDAPDICEYEYEKLMSEENIPAERKPTIYKYNIRSTYHWKSVIDMPFLEKYGDHSTKRIFRNLREIMQSSSLDISLEHIRTNCIKPNDILPGTRYSRHKYAIMLLKACGFSAITDEDPMKPITLTQGEIMASLLQHKEVIEKDMDAICLSFNNVERFVNKDWKYRTIIQWINGKLYSQYGIKLIAVTNKKGQKNIKIHHYYYYDKFASTRVTDMPFIELNWRYKERDKDDEL